MKRKSAGEVRTPRCSGGLSPMGGSLITTLSPDRVCRKLPTDRLVVLSCNARLKPPSTPNLEHADLTCAMDPHRPSRVVRKLRSSRRLRHHPIGDRVVSSSPPWAHPHADRGVRTFPRVIPSFTMHSRIRLITIWCYPELCYQEWHFLPVIGR